MSDFFPRQWECSKKEAKILADTLFGIREYRCFTTSYFSPEEGAVSGQMELPKTIYKEELSDAKEELYYVCIQVVENRVTPNGIELEPEEGVIYTDIQRERF